MILVDSSVWIDYFNGRKTDKTDWLDSAIGNKHIIVGDLILAEILQGFQSDNDFRTAKNLLLDFPFMEMVGQDLAIKSALNYRFLRKNGVTVRKTIDVMIGTFCIHYQCSLLHDDRDFDPMEKIRYSTRYIKVVEWSDEDNCFVGRIPGLIDGGIHGNDEEKVYKELCQVAEEAVELYIESGQYLPPPTANKKYSGKLHLRLSPELHERLSIKAIQKGESLNKLINKVLTSAI